MRYKNYILEQNSQGRWWKDQRFEYDNNKLLLYRGVSNKINAETNGKTTWYVWKYFWDGEDIIRISGPISCNWDDRSLKVWE